MATYDTLLKLSQNPDWIPPRSDVRLFLGEPGAPEATKTTVEPGNAFSPGMRTFGVTWWLRLPESGEFFTTENAPLDALHWRYEAGYLPLVHCETTVAGIEVRHSLFQDGTAAARSEATCALLALANRLERPARLQVFIALRSLGPAGGPVRDLKVGPDGASFWPERGGWTLLAFDRPPAAIGCDIGDPSPLARQGAVPASQAAADPQGWCFGLARFDLRLAPGETWQLHLDCPQPSYGFLSDLLPGAAAPRPGRFAERAKAHLAGWQRRFSHLSLEVPDEDFRNAFFAGLQHMLTAMTGDQARIAPLCYPLPWLRDTVYIIRCLDLAGLPELARAATEYCARNDFFGGFGAEGDAPGEGLWALVEHYRLTRDKAWLERVYPAIQRKCAWLSRMRRAQVPIQVLTDTPILPFMHAQRNAGVICLPASQGLIMGTMDHQVQIGWVNHWAICGLREAAYAAHELGLAQDEASYRSAASELLMALESYIAAHPEYFQWERTANSLLWPTRAWEETPEKVAAGFDAWWRENRGGGDLYRPEPYWLYFEYAQAHNALLLGQRERAWQVIRYRLDHQDLPGLFGWREGANGVGMENAIHGVTLINQLRGCHKLDCITPHGWSQAEMWLLQRAVLVEEWQGGLLLFAGVPAHWLSPGSRIALAGFPTWVGKIRAELVVSPTGRSATITVAGIAAGASLLFRLPGMEVQRTFPGGELGFEVGL